jgi:hypothetical protein
MRTHRRVSRRRLIVVAVAGASALVGLLPGSAGAASAPEGLSRAERLAALRSMTPQERGLLYERFTSDRYVVVGYARTVRSFDRVSGRPVGPARTLALGEAAPLATSGITNLSLTISVTFEWRSTCCRWDILNTFDWTGPPPTSGRGKDQIASAWANGAALRTGSAGAWGYYTDGSLIAFNLQDVTPNVGFNLEFTECKLLCAETYAEWGYEMGTIWQTKRQYQATNLVFKYFHTYGGVEYSIAFGIGPSITISPTSKQVSTAVYLSLIN